MQKVLFTHIKLSYPENFSLIDEVASVLDIGYDAAYRRVNLKTTLTLDESVKLAKHFNISLNKLFEAGSQDTLIVERSPIISELKHLELYFTESINNLKPLTLLKDASIIYSAKDIPFFYALKDSWFTKYKIYVWLKMANKEMTKNKVSFDDFVKTIPDSLLDKAYELGRTYNYINITEFWNDNTINGALEQVVYYYEAQLLSKEYALKICHDIEEIIHHIEKQAIQESIAEFENNASYKLYKSDLLTMSNTIFVKTSFKKAFFVPFTVLEYFKVEHQGTCDIMENFFNKQMANSKLLVHSGEKDRILFFNKMHRKIDSLKDRIKNESYF